MQLLELKDRVLWAVLNKAIHQKVARKHRLDNIDRATIPTTVLRSKSGSFNHRRGNRVQKSRGVLG
jgi:hypothetical protein